MFKFKESVFVSVAAVSVSALTLSMTGCGGGGSGAAPAAISCPTCVSFNVNSTTGNNASAVLGTAPFKTIASAVQYASAVAATNGANIYIASGVYNAASGEVFPIRLTDGINLIGSGIAEVEGAGNFAVGSGERMGSNISTTFAASSPSATNRINVSITGLAASSVGNAPTFISTVNTNLIFTGNTLTYPAGGNNYPMWIMASSVAAVSNNTISAWVALDTADAGTKVVARGNHFDGGFTICTADFTATASQLDLGTAASPGNNTILKTGGGTAGVNSWGGTTDYGVTAVGNTWTPGVQGANGSGQYAASHVVGGTAAATAGPNYSIFPTAGIQF